MTIRPGTIGEAMLDCAGRDAEAVSLITAQAFESGFHRVYLHSALDDPATQRVAMAAGFQREGIARGGGHAPDGSRYDVVVFARLATDPPGPVPRMLPDLPDGELTDGTVTLRPLGPADVEDTYELRSLPEVYLRSIAPRPPERDAVEQLCAQSEMRWLAGERATLTIREAATGAYAGDLGLFAEQLLLGQARLGYSLLPAWRGRGFAARAVRLVTAWAFDQLNLARLVAGTAPDNVASQRVLEAAGFEREAFQRALLPGPDGTRIDNVEYVLHR
jgi:RimJ/RimL family protein N-acetyltransferase